MGWNPCTCACGCSEECTSCANGKAPSEVHVRISGISAYWDGDYVIPFYGSSGSTCVWMLQVDSYYLRFGIDDFFLTVIVDDAFPDVYSFSRATGSYVWDLFLLYSDPLDCFDLHHILTYSLTPGASAIVRSPS